MSEVKPKKKMGRPPWTPEQHEAYRRKMAERKARGLPASNGQDVPLTPEGELDRAMVSKTLNSILDAVKQPRVQSDAELEQRLTNYFQYCADHGITPTMEEMSLYIGYSYSWVRAVRCGFKQGFSPRTKEILERVKNIFGTYDAKLAVAGKMRDAIYIFRSKNFYDMRDQQDVVLNTDVTTERELSREDMEKWFLDDGAVETEFADEDEERG